MSALGTVQGQGARERRVAMHAAHKGFVLEGASTTSETTRQRQDREVGDTAYAARCMGGKQPDGVTQSSAIWMPRGPKEGLGEGRIEGYTALEGGAARFPIQIGKPSGVYSVWPEIPPGLHVSQSSPLGAS